MNRLIPLLILLLWSAMPLWAAPPPWAKNVKTTVTKTVDSEEVIVEVDGVKAGRRQDPSGVYELAWERDPKILGMNYRLQAHKVTKVFAAESEPLPVPSRSNEAITVVADPAPLVIDVNYLYSSAALAQIGALNIDAFAALSCALTNQAYANSGLGYITFRCLGPFLAGFNDLSDGPPLDWMQGRGKPEVDAKLALTGADLSHIVVTNWDCGKSFINATKDLALSMSRVECTNNNLTFAHETGHNIGFQHDPANAGCGKLHRMPSGLLGCRTGYSYGHEWPIGAIQWRDIMVINPAGVRVTQISNPNVLYQGLYPTGIPNERDNARWAVARAPIVAAFRTPTQ